MPAIFGQRMLAAGFSGEDGGSEPVKKYAYRLDGLTQHYRLSGPISLKSGETLEFSFLAPYSYKDGIEMLFSNMQQYNTILRTNDSSGSISSPFGAMFDGGIEISSFATDGAVHTYTLNVELPINLGLIGAQYSGSGFLRRINYPVFNLVHRDLLGNILNEIPLTNKSQGAIQLPTVGDISATIINYTEGGWEEV